MNLILERGVNAAVRFRGQRPFLPLFPMQEGGGVRRIFFLDDPSPALSPVPHGERVGLPLDLGDHNLIETNPLKK
jgi:hypothetical protein